MRPCGGSNRAPGIGQPGRPFVVVVALRVPHVGERRSGRCRRAVRRGGDEAPRRCGGGGNRIGERPTGPRLGGPIGGEATEKRLDECGEVSLAHPSEEVLGTLSLAGCLDQLGIGSGFGTKPRNHSGDCTHQLGVGRIEPGEVLASVGEVALDAAKLGLGSDS